MQDWIDFAEELAQESGELIRAYFGKGVAVERKADRTPVTVADREAEALLRKRIEARYPDHQVLGEEEGLSGAEGARYRWVLDPIDGTKSFIHGVPLFGTLIALLEEGQPILGVIHLPIQRALLLGVRGRETTLNREPVRVSNTRDLREATLAVTSTKVLYDLGYGPAYQHLQERVELVRSWGDCYGHFLVATGSADIMFDPIMNPWDIAALKPCIEGAGGRITDREGGTPNLGESALSTNGFLHDEVLAILKERRIPPR